MKDASVQSRVIGTVISGYLLIYLQTNYVYNITYHKLIQHQILKPRHAAMSPIIFTQTSTREIPLKKSDFGKYAGIGYDDSQDNVKCLARSNKDAVSDSI